MGYGFLPFAVVLDGLEEDVDEVPEVRLVEVSPIINIFSQRLLQVLGEGREVSLHTTAALTEAIRLAEFLAKREVEVLADLETMPKLVNILGPADVLLLAGHWEAKLEVGLLPLCELAEVSEQGV